MPPKKEKVEKTSVEAGTALVLEYLKQQNRPYSSIEISANLHNKVTKPQAAKILKDLAESNLIGTKASGKQSVYHAIQDPKDNLTAQELAQLDVEVTAIRNQLASLKDEEKGLKLQLSGFKTITFVPELRNQLSSLKTEESSLTTRLEDLRSGMVQVVSADEKNEVESSYKLWTYKVAAREKAFNELWQTLSSNLPDGKTKEELWEELGLETPV